MGLRELITESFGLEAAEQWSRFTVGEGDKRKLVDSARKVLEIFPGREPGACCLMSAIYLLALEKMEGPPAYVVAGSLYVGDTCVFGEDGELDGKTRFSQSNLSWDGHAWIVCGDWLSDVSLFRTADGAKSPPALKVHPPTPGPGAHLLRKAVRIDRRLTGGPLGTGTHNSANHTPRKEQQKLKRTKAGNHLRWRPAGPRGPTLSCYKRKDGLDAKGHRFKALTVRTRRTGSAP